MWRSEHCVASVRAQPESRVSQFVARGAPGGPSRLSQLLVRPRTFGVPRLAAAPLHPASALPPGCLPSVWSVPKLPAPPPTVALGRGPYSRATSSSLNCTCRVPTSVRRPSQLTGVGRGPGFRGHSSTPMLLPGARWRKQDASAAQRDRAGGCGGGTSRRVQPGGSREAGDRGSWPRPPLCHELCRRQARAEHPREQVARTAQRGRPASGAVSRVLRPASHQPLSGATVSSSS